MTALNADIEAEEEKKHGVHFDSGQSPTLHLGSVAISRDETTLTIRWKQAKKKPKEILKFNFSEISLFHLQNHNLVQKFIKKI